MTPKIFIAAAISWSFLLATSCQQEAHELPDKSKTYYNADMGLVSENGLMVFLPKAALLKGKDIHTGSIWVDLASPNDLVEAFPPSKETLIQKVQNPKNLFVIRSQEDSVSSDLHIANGKEILLFLPYAENKAPDLELLREAEKFDPELFPQGFMDADFHLKGLKISDPTDANLERLLYFTDDKDEKKQAKSYMEKSKSFRELQSFLQTNWELSQKRYKAKHPDYVDEGDQPRKVGYYVLSMNYLRDPPADSTLLYAFRDFLGGEAFVIMDWTGSMYQYRAELVEFIRHNADQKKLKYLTFYNDLYCEFPREPGNFEGVFTHMDSFPTHAQASRLMHVCESSGSGGGELAENDLEAIITSMDSIDQKYYKEIALVVDNNAPPKDMVLLSDIDLKPDKAFNIFVCRANSLHEVKEEYLALARAFDGNIIVVSREGIVKKSIKEIDTAAI